MRTLMIVATTAERAINRFHQSSMGEARNLKDFLEQTGEYRSVAIYELEGSMGTLKQWTELEESPP